jgi:hypothetical protein
VDFENLSVGDFSHFIISRLMEHGDEAALRFLMRSYSRRELVETLRTSRSISRRSRKFWALLLDIEEESCTAKRYPTPFGVGSIKVDYLRERIFPRFPLKTLVTEGGRFQVADPADIGRMKLLSIASRGGKKDFIDLYCLTRSVIPLEELLTLVLEEQGSIRFNRLLFLKGLVDFEEAEKEAPPMMLWAIDWNKVKEDLGEEVKRIGRKWS